MNIIQRFLRSGTENARDQFDARRIMLLNLFCGVGCLALLASLVQSRMVGEPTIMAVMLSAAVVLMIGVPFLGRRNPNLGSAYLLFLANLIVLVFANTQGLESGTYFYYFPVFFANAWLMDFRKPLHALAVLSMTIVGVIAVVCIPEGLFGLLISPEIQHASFIFNLILATVIMAINTMTIVWLNYRRQKDLEERIVIIEKTSSQLESALKEKEVLLAEIHHRVKNNLAVIRGMLNMQMNTSSDDIARSTLRESVSRVSAMALIHQKLYNNVNPNKIDLKTYVTELVNEVATTFRNNSNLNPIVSINISDVAINLNKAVPCGLILNELLTNAYKHAFKNQPDPRISISISANGNSTGEIKLVVEDNGSGMSSATNPETAETLGMILIQSLSEQLDGQFTIGPGEKKGTRAELVFPNNIN